ncbi:ANTAR domain-containing protein [Arthrobacter sp. H14]|uniref:ANTAR domain-containing protein n=1 Tax=Arthrobacter sp. H14 TaxID=1312959 RepID=UPI000479ED13|nr:ANTAR domain-containing protein [Arthrobacter sp. H14]
MSTRRPDPNVLSSKPDQVRVRLSEQARKIEHLEYVIAEREMIGVAKGILMERYKITAEQAHGFLARASADADAALDQTAAQLIRGDELTL